MVEALAKLPHTHQPAMETFESDAVFFLTQAQVCMNFVHLLLIQRNVTCQLNNGQLIYIYIYSFGMCRMRQFLAFLRSFSHSSLLYTLSFHLFPPKNLPSSLTSSCHLFLGLPLSFAVSKFMYNTYIYIYKAV